MRPGRCGFGTPLHGLDPVDRDAVLRFEAQLRKRWALDMGRTVFDVAWDRPSPEQLKAAGAYAVCRYLSYDTTGKNLTRAEAQSYADAGIFVVSNWEYWEKAASWGHDQGLRDARTAVAQHRDCGGPGSKPIYYSVDFDIPDYRPDLPIDTSPENNRLKLGPVAGYFQAVTEVHGDQPIGVYGGYWAVSRVLNAKLADYGWQTYGWSANYLGGGTLWDTRACLRQVENGIHIANHDADRDEALVDDFGQWMPQNYTPAPPPVQAPPQTGTHAPGSRMLLLTAPFMEGADVSFVQRWIGPRQCGPADGVYGPHTKSGVLWYQGMRGITVDGVVGPQTWGQMGVKWKG